MSLTNTVKELFTSLQQLSRPTLALLAACGSADESQGCRTDYDCREGRVCQYDPQAGERYCSSGSDNPPPKPIPPKGPVDVSGSWCEVPAQTPQDCSREAVWHNDLSAGYLELSPSGETFTGQECDYFDHDCENILDGRVKGRQVLFSTAYSYGGGGRLHSYRDVFLTMVSSGNRMEGTRQIRADKNLQDRVIYHRVGQ